MRCALKARTSVRRTASQRIFPAQVLALPIPLVPLQVWLSLLSCLWGQHINTRPSNLAS